MAGEESTAVSKGRGKGGGGVVAGPRYLVAAKEDSWLTIHTQKVRKKSREGCQRDHGLPLRSQTASRYRAQSQST